MADPRFAEADLGQQESVIGQHYDLLAQDRPEEAEAFNTEKVFQQMAHRATVKARKSRAKLRPYETAKLDLITRFRNSLGGASPDGHDALQFTKVLDNIEEGRAKEEARLIGEEFIAEAGLINDEFRAGGKREEGGGAGNFLASGFRMITDSLSEGLGAESHRQDAIAREAALNKKLEANGTEGRSGTYRKLAEEELMMKFEGPTHVTHFSKAPLIKAIDAVMMSDEEIQSSMVGLGADKGRLEDFMSNRLPKIREEITSLVIALRDVDPLKEERAGLTDTEYTKAVIQDARKQGGGKFFQSAQSAFADLGAGTMSTLGAGADFFWPEFLDKRMPISSGDLKDAGALRRRQSAALKLVTSEVPGSELMGELGSIAPDLLIALIPGLAATKAGKAMQLSGKATQRAAVGASALGSGASAGVRTVGSAMDAGLGDYESMRLGLRQLLITGGVTAGMGATGLQAVFAKQATRDAIGKLIKTRTIAGAGAKGGAHESVEEGIDTVLSHFNIETKINPNITPDQLADNFITSLKLGFIPGAGFGTAKGAIDVITDPTMSAKESAETRRGQDLIQEEVARREALAQSSADAAESLGLEATAEATRQAEAPPVKIDTDSDVPQTIAPEELEEGKGTQVFETSDEAFAAAKEQGKPGDDISIVKTDAGFEIKTTSTEGSTVKATEAVEGVAPEAVTKEDAPAVEEAPEVTPTPEPDAVEGQTTTETPDQTVAPEAVTKEEADPNLAKPSHQSKSGKNVIPPQDVDKDALPVGSVVFSPTYKSERTPPEIIKVLEPDERGPRYEVIFKGSGRTMSMSATQIESVLSVPPTEQATPEVTPTPKADAVEGQTTTEPVAPEVSPTQEAGDAPPTQEAGDTSPTKEAGDVSPAQATIPEVAPEQPVSEEAPTGEDAKAPEAAVDYTLGGRITEAEGRKLQSSDLIATRDLDSPDYLPTVEVIRIAKKLVGEGALRDRASRMGLGTKDADLETAAREILDIESSSLPYTEKRTVLPHGEKTPKATASEGKLTPEENNRRAEEGRLDMSEEWRKANPTGAAPLNMKAPTPEETWFHGGSPDFRDSSAPVFLTRQREGAEWFADERGGAVNSTQVGAKNPARNADLEEAVRETGATEEDIKANSPYDGANPLDYIYVPRVQEYLRAKGFDSVLASDTLETSEIDALVVLDPKSLPAKETPKPKEAKKETKEEAEQLIGDPADLPKGVAPDPSTMAGLQRGDPALASISPEATSKEEADSPAAKKTKEKDDPKAPAQDGGSPIAKASASGPKTKAAYKAVMEALDGISKESADVFSFVFFGGKSFKEAAKEFSISENTAKERWDQALEDIPSELLDPIRTERSQEVSPSATMNAVMEAESNAMGAPSILKAAAVGHDVAFNEAGERIAADPDIAEKIIDGLLSGEKNSISLTDDPILLREEIRLKSERRTQGAIIRDKETSDADRKIADSRFRDIEAQLGRLRRALARTGDMGGKFLRARRDIRKEDFSAESMKDSVAAELGRPLEPKEEKQIEKDAASIEAGLALEEMAIELAKERARSKQLEGVIEDQRKANRKRARASLPFAEYAKKWVADHAPAVAAATARAEAKKKEGRLHMGLDPSNTPDNILLAMDAFARNYTKLDTFTKEIVSLVGESIRPYAKALFEKVQEAHGSRFSKSQLDKDTRKAENERAKKQGELKRFLSRIDRNIVMVDGVPTQTPSKAKRPIEDRKDYRSVMKQFTTGKAITPAILKKRLMEAGWTEAEADEGVMRGQRVRDARTARIAATAKAKATRQREAAKKKANKVDATNEERLTIVENNLKDRAKDPENTMASHRPTVLQYVENLLRDGVDVKEDIVEATHDMMKKIFPEIDQSTVEDLIAGFGDFTEETDQESELALGRANGELRVQVQVMRLKEGATPDRGSKKPGPTKAAKKDKKDKVAYLHNLKTRKRLMEEGGFTEVDVVKAKAKAFKDSKARARKAMDDISNAINSLTKKLTMKNREEVLSEIGALQAKHKEAKAAYDATYKNTKLTAKEKEAAQLAAIRSDLAEVKEDIRLNRLYNTPLSPPLTEATRKAKRARQESLEDEEQAMLDMQTLHEETISEEKLMKRLLKLTNEPEQAAQNAAKKRKQQFGPESPRMEEVRKILDEVNKARRKAPQQVAHKIDLLVEKAKDTILRNRARLAKGEGPKKKTEDSPTSPELELLKGENEALLELIAEAKKRKPPTKEAVAIRLAQWKTRALARKARYEERKANKDFTVKPRTPIRLDQEGKDIAAAVNKSKQDFKAALLEAQQADRGLVHKGWDEFVALSNASRAMMTAGDFSAVFRQAAPLSMSHPLLLKRAIKPMLQAIKKANAIQLYKELQATPRYHEYESAGLALHDPDESNAALMVENFQSKLVKKIPGVSQSQTAYVTYLNVIRTSTYDHLIGTLESSGVVTQDDRIAIANFINVFTGHGGVAVSSKAGANINALLFSPRLLVSRFEILFGQPLWGRKKSARTRNIILQEYMKFIMISYTVLTAATLAGADVGWDPTDSDFLKIKVGNTRVDIFGGLQQMMVLLGRTVQAGIEAKQGKEVLWGENKWSITAFRFIKNKLNPTAGLFANILDRENAVGEPTTLWSPLLNFAPMVAVETFQALKDDGWDDATAIFILGVLGFGVSNYEKKSGKGRSSRKIGRGV